MLGFETMGLTLGLEECGVMEFIFGLKSDMWYEDNPYEFGVDFNIVYERYPYKNSRKS